jgi:hypothetical protein
MDLRNFLEKGDELYLPNLSIDLVIIGYAERELKCLLLQVGEKWLLPGGYIQREESVDEAVGRILKDRTALEKPHLRFLSVFGDKDRQFSSEIKESIERSGIAWKSDYWLNDRFVTLAYYSLVHIPDMQPAVKNFDEAFAWFPFDALPEMWMDHRAIVRAARKRLKEDIQKDPETYNLLPDPFTMPELHQLHEAILEEKLDRSRFQKKMLSSGLFERLPARKRDAPGRNPYQYRVKVADLPAS